MTWLYNVSQKHSLSSPLPNISFLSKLLNLIGCHKRLNLWKKYSKFISSEAIRGIKLKLCRNVHNIRLCKNGIFIAVAHVLSLLWQFKRSFHWFIMGKVKIGLYCYLTADILTRALQKCSLSSPLPNILFLSKSLNLIGCYGNRKAEFAKKIFKNHLWQNQQCGCVPRENSDWACAQSDQSLRCPHEESLGH